MRCECRRCQDAGLVDEMEDEVTQMLIEEACYLVFDALQSQELEGTPEPPKPGEITDPEVQKAMELAKELHDRTHNTNLSGSR